MARAQSNSRQGALHEPLFDVHPRTGANIEVFYADRALETFGRCGSGVVLLASPARLSPRRVQRPAHFRRAMLPIGMQF